MLGPWWSLRLVSGLFCLCWILAPTLSCSGRAPAKFRKVVSVQKIPPLRIPLSYEVSSGDTIETICRRTAGDDWVDWRDALVSEMEPRSLRPGLLFEGERDHWGKLRKLQCRLNLASSILWEKNGDTVQHRRRELPVDSSIRRFDGTIQSSLFADIEKLGAHPDLALRMASVFQWDIDFSRGLRVGDRFSVLVEEKCVGDTHFGYGVLYAARFINDGRDLKAIAYAGADGAIGYYDLEGRALKKQFLRSPMKFSRITSPFSMHRFHPIFHRNMPHYGVDYGAPVGTPVYATADGQVSFVGRNGGAGKMVRLRHANGYETNYLHLSAYGKGIHRGVRVHQKQIVGYVGATGAATGPHLDYRVKKNGKWINPRSISSPPAPPLPSELLPRFLAHALAIMQILDGKDAPLGARC